MNHGYLVIIFHLILLGAIFAQQPPDPSNDLYTGSQVTYGNILLSEEDTRLSLDPGKVHSNNKDYYFLRLDYQTGKDTIHINPGDLLLIVLHDITIKLDAVKVLFEKQQVVAYYYINKLDLFDLGSATTARVVAFGGDESIQAEFSADNLKFIHEFAMMNIFAELESLPEPDEPLWGFLAGGAGKSYSFCLGFYLKPFKNTDIRDFLAIGAGWQEFEYQDYKIVSDQWIPVEYHSRQIIILRGMYGISFPVNLITRWRLECGLTIEQYQFNKEEWELHKIKVHNQIKILNGDPNSGFTYGAYLQAGSFWASINHFGDWTAGISIPVK